MPGPTFFPNLSKLITFEAAPSVLTPFVRNQGGCRAGRCPQLQVEEGEPRLVRGGPLKRPRSLPPSVRGVGCPAAVFWVRKAQILSRRKSRPCRQPLQIALQSTEHCRRPLQMALQCTPLDHDTSQSFLLSGHVLFISPGAGKPPPRSQVGAELSCAFLPQWGLRATGLSPFHIGK